MNQFDILVLIFLFFWSILAVRHIYRRKKCGKCTGCGCGGANCKGCGR